jgi:hypothetical protein
MIGSPFPNGACHETVASVSPRVAITPAGVEGRPAGITGADGAEIADLSTSVVANTMNEYDVPLLNPVTMQLVVATEHTWPPPTSMTVYDNTGTPLPFAAVHVTVTRPSPRVPTTSAGAVGRPAGVTAVEAAEASEVPIKFDAVTVNV